MTPNGVRSQPWPAQRIGPRQLAISGWDRSPGATLTGQVGRPVVHQPAALRTEGEGGDDEGDDYDGRRGAHPGLLARAGSPGGPGRPRTTSGCRSRAPDPSRTSSSAYCSPASRRTRATGDQALLGDGGALCRGRIPPYPYPSATRDRASAAIRRPVAFPKCPWNARKRPLSPSRKRRHNED